VGHEGLAGRGGDKGGRSTATTIATATTRAGDAAHATVTTCAKQYAISKARATRRQVETCLPPENWWMNGGIICNVMPSEVWGNTHFHELAAMLDAACAYARNRGGCVPDCDFFVNKRDYPQLRRDGAEPYSRFLHSCSSPLPLTRESYGVYAPVFSFYTGADMADLPMPTTDDWRAAVAFAADAPSSKPAPLASASASTGEAGTVPLLKAVFRGSATGLGVTATSNVRLRLAEFGRARPDLVDVGITSLNETRDRVLPVVAHALPPGGVTDIWVGTPTLARACGMVDADKHPLPSRAPFMPLADQCSAYACVLYADGHCAASRYGTLMHAGRAILRIRSEHAEDCGHLWLFPGLVGARFVPEAPELRTPLNGRDHDATCDTAVVTTIPVPACVMAAAAAPVPGQEPGVNACVLASAEDATRAAQTPAAFVARTRHQCSEARFDHCVIDSDLCNLEATIAVLRAAPELFDDIARHAKLKAPTTTSIACYWSRMLHEVARCQGHDPAGRIGATTDASGRAGSAWFSPWDARYAREGTVMSVGKGDASTATSTSTSICTPCFAAGVA
jgi:hypothetical protein